MNKILEIVIEAAKDAGELITSFYNSEFEVKMKGIGNPVTEADIAADKKDKIYPNNKFP